MQGLFGAFFYNAGMIPLAILGMMHPVLAEIAMAISSVTVVTNANLLRRVNIQPEGGRCPANEFAATSAKSPCGD